MNRIKGKVITLKFNNIKRLIILKSDFNFFIVNLIQKYETNF